MDWVHSLEIQCSAWCSGKCYLRHGQTEVSLSESPGSKDIFQAEKEESLHSFLGYDGIECWAEINLQDSSIGVFLVQMSDDWVKRDWYCVLCGAVGPIRKLIWVIWCREAGCVVWFDKPLKTLHHNGCQCDGACHSDRIQLIFLQLVL